jgi:LysM repeat protein
LEKKNKQGNRDFSTSLQNETLRDVAQNNGVQLKSLMQLNNMNESELIMRGTKIKLR